MLLDVLHHWHWNQSFCIYLSVKVLCILSCEAVDNLSLWCRQNIVLCGRSIYCIHNIASFYICTNILQVILAGPAVAVFFVCVRILLMPHRLSSTTSKVSCNILTWLLLAVWLSTVHCCAAVSNGHLLPSVSFTKW